MGMRARRTLDLEELRMQRPLPIVRENGGQADQTFRVGSFGLSRELHPRLCAKCMEILTTPLSGALFSTFCGVFTTKFREI